jgi:light-regulated signal transduction histidine kinase (bacteriophytochrome)
MPASEPPTISNQAVQHGRHASARSAMPRWIALGYLAFGALWIFVTDRALVWLQIPASRVAHLQTSKGWLFVFASSVLLYLLVSLLQRRNDAALQALSDRESDIRRMNAELERRVAQRTEQLEATNRELESFAYAVSHDLRAPLRSMSGFSQLLQESPTSALDEKSRHYLQRINDASKRMSTLIEDLLNLSRISRTELTPRNIDFTQLITDVATIVRERHPGRVIEVQIEPGMTIEGDQRLLKIAMENLLDNAFKYTAHTAVAQVSVGTQTDERGCTFYVRDNGVGFDMAYSSKLFGPFQRLHSDAQYPGTGIGLVTVQRILARHGGRIWVEAALDQGATFYFTVARDGLPTAASSNATA